MKQKRVIIILAAIAAVVLLCVIFRDSLWPKSENGNVAEGYYELKDEMKVGSSIPADAHFVRDDDGSIPDEEMDKLKDLFGHHKLGIKQGICSAGGWYGKKLLILYDADAAPLLSSEVVLELDDSYDVSVHPNEQGISSVDEETCSYKLFPLKEILSVRDHRQ
ncbi:MAG: hypothetical protein IJ744_05955 [Lachnospiraceae bacterium]|nr:hypothetical protein [Lachnospiraceae bacterium]